MDEVQLYMNKGKPVVLISGSIFSSAIFVGSVFLYQTNEFLGSVGMIASSLIMISSVFF